MADSYEARQSKQRRSSKACQGCRTSKIKCEPVIGRQECRRCLDTSSTCQFSVSRRGRIKGSKNLRTLERLSQRQHHSSSQIHTGSPDVSSDGRFSETPQNCQQCQTEPHQTLEPEVPNNRCTVGTVTPWDPQNLAVQREEPSGPNRATLARKLLHILGEFPVDNVKCEEDSDECKAKGLQEPLWLLANLAEKGWDLDEAKTSRARSKQPARPLGELSLDPELQHRLRKWTPKALQEVEKEQKQYFKHGIFASRRDVAPALDPINHGLVTEQRAAELFEVYWKTIHTQWAMLDPALHTPESVRQRSALLTTTILALGSTASLTTAPEASQEHATEALRLHAHVEKISLVVYATGARSVDIVQAQILLSRWGTAPKTRAEEQRWMRAGIIPRMATEIGLTRPPRAGDEQDAAKISQLRRNDLRTRIFLIINEYRFSTYNGRQALDMTQFELSEEDLEEIAEEPHRKLGQVPPTVLYDLFLFDRETRRRISREDAGRHSSLLDAELEHVKAYMEAWMQDWCPGSANPSVNWYLIHEAVCCWLLLVVHVAKIRLQKDLRQRQRHQQQQQQLMSTLAVRMFTEALKANHALCTTQRATIFPFAASIVLRLTSRSDLVLQVALRMAGEPNKPHVPTFVREAGCQMLLMLYRNNSNSARTWTADEQNESNPQTVLHNQEHSGSHAHSSVPREDTRMPDLPENNAWQYHPDHCLTETSLLEPSNFNGMFSLNPNDLPNVPDISQPQLSLQDPFSRYYDFEDLDALIGASEPMNFASTDPLQPRMDLFQPTPPSAPMTMPYESIPGEFQIPSERSVQEPGMAWPIEGISPSSTGMEPNQNGPGGEDRNAQRSFVLSAVNTLIQLASRI